MPKFVFPSSIVELDGTMKAWPLPNDRPARHDFYFSLTPGLIYEANEVRQCIRSGRIESELITHDDSIQIAHIQDEMRRQIGLTYPEDN